MFKSINKFIDISLRLFNKMEIHAYRLTREFMMELLVFAYAHDKFKEIIVAPISFYINFKELYGAYMDQWEK